MPTNLLSITNVGVLNINGTFLILSVHIIGLSAFLLGLGDSSFNTQVSFRNFYSLLVLPDQWKKFTTLGGLWNEKNAAGIQN